MFASQRVRILSMAALLRLLFSIFLAFPVLAQDSTEPPPPKASPVISVVEESLPRAGGVIVFGGTRGVGLEVVRQLVAKNEHVTVVARETSDTTALKAMQTTFVNIVTGDALDPDAVKKAFTSAPFRSVVSTLGGHGRDYSVDVEGNKNVVDAAKNAGLTRMVMVSAIGAGDSGPSLPWYLRLFMKKYFIAKTAAEAYLKSSGLDYTIIRPGVLLDDGKPGQASLQAATPSIPSGIKRSDVGLLIANIIEDMSTFKKTFVAVDARRIGLWALLTY
jgi:uncharacterized protein YbjT (DUF2867 family)